MPVVGHAFSDVGKKGRSFPLSHFSRRSETFPFASTLHTTRFFLQPFGISSRNWINISSSAVWINSCWVNPTIYCFSSELLGKNNRDEQSHLITCTGDGINVGKWKSWNWADSRKQPISSSWSGSVEKSTRRHWWGFTKRCWVPHGMKWWKDQVLSPSNSVSIYRSALVYLAARLVASPS